MRTRVLLSIVGIGYRDANVPSVGNCETGLIRLPHSSRVATGFHVIVFVPLGFPARLPGHSTNDDCPAIFYIRFRTYYAERFGSPRPT